MTEKKTDFEMQFDIGTIKHLGLQMYSTLPPVIGELVSNAWDADATKVEITIPEDYLTDNSEIVIWDDGKGMSDEDVRKAYLIVGRDKRKEEGDKPTSKYSRAVMGRKGIGKFSGFGIANIIEIETVKNEEVSHFEMNYKSLEESADKRVIKMPPLSSTGKITVGTRVVLRDIKKFRTRSIDVVGLRRGLARRFAIIGANHTFEVSINGVMITPEERDLKRLLELDDDGRYYIWEYKNEEIAPNTGLTVSGWIGALNRTTPLDDGIQRGIVIMARGKLVQEPFIFNAVAGQQFALSYLVGEIYADFVDEAEDTVGTTRNSLVWDSENNKILEAWGQKKVNEIARQWAEKRRFQKEKQLEKNETYKRFKEEIKKVGGVSASIADKLVRKSILDDPLNDVNIQEQIVQYCLDFAQYDAFLELAEEISSSNISDVGKIVALFTKCEILEAKEMMRVLRARIETIEKFQKLVETNAREVPTIHNFFKKFPWVLDPRWTLVADEQRYSKLLTEHFPDDDSLEEDRRIDFLCVRESSTLVVCEIKRPHSKASKKQLDQIEEYTNFMRKLVKNTTDPDFQTKNVIGYLLVGEVVEDWRERVNNLESAKIYVRRYDDLLDMVERLHKEFLERYNKLQRGE